MRLRMVLLALTALLAPACSAEPPMVFPIPGKKIIELGWDVVSPAYLRDHLRAIEARPFDGVAIRLPDAAGGGNVFDIRKWAKTTPAARERALEAMAAIPSSQRLTDNFVVLYGASTMDWFRDADWRRVLENVRYCARAAKAGRCKGVIWDPEPYSGTNPWRYAEQPGRGGRSFAEYAQVVRRRGAQFMQALQQEFPGLTILSLRELSDFQDGSPFSAHLLPVRDSRAAEQGLADAWWGLHPAFTNGLLDVIAPDVTLVDGNEDSYYYTSALDFYRAYHTLRQDAQALVDPVNRHKYAAQYQVGQALAVDYVVGRWADALSSFPAALRQQGLMLTPDERARWFEHNVYYALATADRYVWCYSERMNWWTGEGIPPGIEEAIRSARRKYAAGGPLGFTVESMLAGAQRKAQGRADKPSPSSTSNP